MDKINGWLNLYKPKNISSAKFLAKVKKFANGQKLGHTGTLDPLAEGVLPVAIGEATKLCDLLISSRKKYYFVVQFGGRTASGDLGTEIIEKKDSKIKLADIQNILSKFLGKIEQTPSKYSAIKINGKRAYRLARENAEFEMPKRIIEIFDIQLDFFEQKAQQAGIYVECSKGTYIRSLAEDIAFSLNNIGYVLELHRVMVGKFYKQNSIKLEKPDEDFDFDTLRQKILPVDYVLDDILVIDAEKEIADKIRFGQKVTFKGYDNGFYAIFSKSNLCAIGTINCGVFESKRVFNLT